MISSLDRLIFTGAKETTATSPASTSGDHFSAECSVRASRKPSPMPRNDPSRTKLVK
jgi:hypothetical protein